MQMIAILHELHSDIARLVVFVKHGSEVSLTGNRHVFRTPQFDTKYPKIVNPFHNQLSVSRTGTARRPLPTAPTTAAPCPGSHPECPPPRTT